MNCSASSRSSTKPTIHSQGLLRKRFTGLSRRRTLHTEAAARETLISENDDGTRHPQRSLSSPRDAFPTRDGHSLGPASQPVVEEDRQARLETHVILLTRGRARVSRRSQSDLLDH